MDAAQCATLESARKHAALALYRMTRRPDLAARVVDAGGRRAMRALRGEAASEETRARWRRCAWGRWRTRRDSVASRSRAARARSIVGP